MREILDAFFPLSRPTAVSFWPTTGSLGRNNRLVRVSRSSTTTCPNGAARNE
jgi:hypothetical protein